MSSRNPMTPWLPATQHGKPHTGSEYPCPAHGASTPSSFVDSNPKGVSPTTGQKPPTDAKPITQRQRMAGYG